MKPTSHTTQAGFTLVELLVTTSLTVLLMLTITTLFATFLLSNSKTNVKKTLKEEGLYAQNQMEFLIKNAFYIDGTCTQNMNSITVVSLDKGSTVFNTQSGRIASNSAALTSDGVTLNGLEFDCSGERGNHQVGISFTLQKVVPTLGANETVTETFSTTVNVRN